MPRPIIVIALAAALLTALPASAARKKPRPVPRPAGQIACTHFGCVPIPPGCHSETGYLWNGLPSGYDVIVCPGYR
jgi:hypothetical protein